MTPTQRTFTITCALCSHEFTCPDREFGEARLILHMEKAHPEELAKAGGAKAISFADEGMPVPKKRK